MGGGLMQLVAYGAQDIYLTGNPQITFFKVVYRRHTNFSMESIEQTFNGTANWGKKVTCTISRNGDLIHRVYLQVHLPQVRHVGTNNAMSSFRWLNHLGHVLVKNVEVEIGGQRIDKHYSHWLHIWHELTCSSEHADGYDAMIGNVPALTVPKAGTAQGTTAVLNDAQEFRGINGAAGNANVTGSATPDYTLYIPLQFWFCRNPGLALPLIALQYHEVKINIEFRQLNEVSWQDLTVGITDAGGNALLPGAGAPNAANTTVAGALSSRDMVSASLWVDYIYLDTDERRRFAQVSHEYLIEQLQFTGDESVSTRNNKIKLNFNHPVKELVFVVQRDTVVDFASMDALAGQQWFNYSDLISTGGYLIHGGAHNGRLGCVNMADLWTPLNMMDSTRQAQWQNVATDGTGVNLLANDNQALGLQPNYDAEGVGFNPMANVLANDIFFQTVNQQAGNRDPTAGVGNILDGAAAGTAQGDPSLGGRMVYEQGGNPVDTAKLQLNGHDRFSVREGSYFNLVQPYQHHTRIPSVGINVYSFGLKPEEHQPSGTCNMSRIDNATLQLNLSVEATRGNRTCKVRVFATNYNVLRIMSGMGGLAYSN